MKNPLFFLLAVLCIASCSPPGIYQQRINDIPTNGPNFNAEVRFIADGLPSKPYYEIIDFNFVEKGGFSKKMVEDFLEIAAIKEGVDAIIEVDFWQEMNEESTFFTIMLDMLDEDMDHTTITSRFTHIRGRGIIYLQNLYFIENQPEYEYVYKIDPVSGFPTPFFKIEYKLTGEEYMVYPEEPGSLDVYKKFIQFYSDYHLLRQREQWTYKMDGDVLKRRTLRDQNGLAVKTCIPTYADGRVDKVKIVHSSTRNSEFVFYNYNDLGQILERRIEMYDGVNIFEDYIYENEQLSGKKIFVNIPNQRIQLSTSLHYYDPDYLKDYYFDEVVRQHRSE